MRKQKNKRKMKFDALSNQLLKEWHVIAAITERKTVKQLFALQRKALGTPLPKDFNKLSVKPDVIQCGIRLRNYHSRNIYYDYRKIYEY